MNFSSSRTLQVSALALIALVSTSISYSASATTQSIGKAKVSATVLPTVTAHAGVAPVLGKPAGNPPTVLTKKDIIVGKGKAAVSSSTVTAQYVLMSWKTGKVLQSSWVTPKTPPTFSLSGVITGWQQGIPGMKVGGRRLLVIPPALAYGAAGSGPVGPNETLIFVVDLVAVK